MVPISTILIIVFIVNIIIANLLNWAYRATEKCYGPEQFLVCLGAIVIVILNIVLILTMFPL